MSRKKKSRRNRSGSSSRSLSRPHSQTHKMPDTEPQAVPSADAGVITNSVWHFKQAWAQLKSGNLVHITLIYLAIPLLLFLLGWLKLIYALPLAALMIFLLVHWLGEIKTEVRPTTRSLVICGIITLVWLSASGVGGFGAQNYDYVKHNAMLKALTFSEWPVLLGSDASLVYTIGYYLPAAAFGKVFGWLAANLALFAWTAFGVTLVMLWFTHHVRGKVEWLAPLFVIIAGMDIIGWYMYWSSEFPSWGYEVEWPVGKDYFQYSGMTSAMYWVPQHAISGWLGAAAFWQLKDEENLYKNSLLLGACITLWSFFAALGLAFLIILYFVFHPQLIRAALSPLKQTGGALLMVVLFLFITSSNFSIDYGLFTDELTERGAWSRYVIFLLIEFGVIGVCAILLTSGQQRRMLIAICILLMLLPLYKIGALHDMAMRASIPILFLFWCLAFNSFIHNQRRLLSHKLFKSVIVLAIAVGIIQPVMEVYRSLSRYKLGPPDSEYVQALSIYTDVPGASNQYIGHRQSPFFQLLASTDINTDAPAFLSQQAGIYLGQGYNEEALETYQRIISLTPNDQQAYFNQGTALMRLNRFQEARQSYEQLQAIDPNYIPELVNAYSGVGHLEAALEFLQYASAANPSNAQSHVNLGFALMRLNRLQGAAASFERALEIAPNLEAPRIYLDSIRGNTNSSESSKRL